MSEHDGHPEWVDLMEVVLRGQPKFDVGPLPCQNRPDLFDPQDWGEPHEAVVRRHRAAVTLCKSCPGLDQCAELSKVEPNPHSMVWAGRSPVLDRGET
ncbi:hypothetical protein [Gordonia zhaorongruii]|uniref:hypothetical protein n=1 Tax=Gordonia zhaorongruii TaxID=2597659 RepID=UPI00117EA569|nr:hypothetical protein [Gordonia zhaorongruii]